MNLLVDQNFIALLAAVGVPYHDREGNLTLEVPCDARGSLQLGTRLTRRSVYFGAFFLRRPDVRHEEVYERVLGKHLDSHIWRFALDHAGDLAVVGVLPRPGLTTEALDEALGALALLVDGCYENLVRTGFDVPDDVVVVGAPPWARSDQS